MKYIEQVKRDIRKWIEDNMDYLNLNELKTEKDFSIYLSRRLWEEDSITGVSSGSYTGNVPEAKEYVFGDTETVINAADDFCCDVRTVTEKFLNGDWEWFDVEARCYVLYVAIDEVVKEIFAERRK